MGGSTEGGSSVSISRVGSAAGDVGEGTSVGTSTSGSAVPASRNVRVGRVLRVLRVIPLCVTVAVIAVRASWGVLVCDCVEGT